MRRIILPFILAALWAVPAYSQSSFPGALPVGCSNNQIAVYQSATRVWVCGSGSGTGDVTASTTLTSNAVVLGGGTTAVKVVAGIFTDGTSKLTLGQAGTSAGGLVFSNATTGTITFTPVTGALGTIAIAIPAVAGNLATTTGTLTSGRCAEFDASGRIVQAAAACGSGGSGDVTASGTLTASALMLGGGTTVISALGSLGTTTTVLHGNAAGAPTFAAVSNSDLAGSIALTKLATQAATTVVANNTGGAAAPTAVTFTDLATAMGIIDIPSVSQGDLLYGSAADTISLLSKAAGANYVLTSNGTSQNPAWGNALTLSFHMLWTPAVCQNATASLGFSTPTTLGAAPTCISTTAASGDPAYASGTFAAGGADTEAHGNFPLFSDWTGAIDLTLKWNSLSAASGDVVWQVQFGCTATGEVPTSISFNNTVFTAVANQTSPTAAFNVSTKTGITTTGCAAGEQAFFIIHRDTDTSGDTLDQAVELLSVDFVYRRAVVIGG